MTKNLAKQIYHKEIESEICLDQEKMEKMNLPNNQNINFSFSNNNLNNSENYNDNQKSFFQTNILLNSLQEFFKYYDEKKIFLKKRFIISFNELFLLLSESILSQESIDNIMYNKKENNIDNIKEINQKYLNDLSYKIFSFNIIDYNSDNNNDYNNNPILNIKTKKKIKSNISPYNFKFQNTSKIKASFNNSQVYILPNHFKNEINTIFDNIYNKIFINNATNNFSHHLKKSKKKGRKINRKTESSQRSKTKNKTYNEDRNKSAILNRKNKSPLNTSKSSINLKKNILYNNSSNNNSVISSKSSNYLTNKNANNKKSFNKKKLSKKKEALKKSNTYRNIKTSKNSDKDLLKSSDIYLACENINKIKKTGNKKLFSKRNKMRQIDPIDNNTFIKKKHKSVGLKNVYNKSEVTDLVGCKDLKLNHGIKKIIISYTHKPSDFVNKLVVNGQKFVDDFEELNEDYSKMKKSKKN